MTIETQIRDLVRDIDGAQIPITGMAIRTGTTRAETVIERRMPALVWAALAAAVVAILLLPILFFGGSESDVVTTLPVTVPSTTVPDTTIPDPIVGLPAPTVEWEIVTFDGVDGPLHGWVKAGEGRFLALQYGLEGFTPDGSAPVDLDGDPRTILWTSVDGAAWEPHAIDVSESNRPTLVGEVNGRVLIRQWQHDDGTWDSESDRPGEFVTYVSEDLATWTRVVFPQMQYERNGSTVEYLGYLFDVISTDTAVILRGNDPLVLTDSDLSTFELLEAPFGYEPRSGDPLYLLDITATRDHFYATVYSNDAGQFSIWSSADGRTWAEEEIDGGALRGDGIEVQIGASDDLVLVYAGPRRWYVAESGEPFELVEGLSATGEPTWLEGDSEGFLFTGASGIGDGDGIRSVGPYVTADGRNWSSVPMEGVSWGTNPAVVGEWILVPTGSWKVEFNEDGDVAGESWEQDGGWIRGRLIPAG
jgi:hypothetical protein